MNVNPKKQWGRVGGNEGHKASKLSFSFLDSRVIGADELFLALLGLREGESTITSEPLDGPDFLDSFLELFHARPVVGEVELLDLLDDMIGLGAKEPLIAFPGEVTRQTADGDEQQTEVEHRAG